MKFIKQLVWIFWLPAAVFLLNELLMSVIEIYTLYPWFDIPMHAIGGASMAYSFFLLIKFWKSKNYIGKMNFAVEFFFIISLVALTAVFWEFYEFMRDTFLGEHTQLGIADTMGDLFMGLLGAFICEIFLLNKKRLA